jgi:hypothetical protein
MLSTIPAAMGAVDYDSNDFASEVIEYVQGTDIPNDLLSNKLFNDPNTAIGRPTLETTGDGWYIPPYVNVPVVPVYAPFRAFEVVTVGTGGRMTVKFNHPVANDRNNPYGIDFIIFGNTAQTIAGSQNWTNGNPEQIAVSGSTIAEPGKVAVSQNGIDWYYFTNGPYADSFAPTASYAWDEVNDVWADELNPLLPIDPNLTAASLNGMTVAEVIESYNGSAGGTGFDIGLLGLDWIQYVRIEDDPATGVTSEIDALADVSCCGDYKHPFPAGDFNENCRVDFFDFAILAHDWITEDNWDDLSDLANNWLKCTWKCP